MAAIKKIYSFTNKKDIWRLVPSESGYLVIEERDIKTKEVFFNCLKTNDGEMVFKNYQFEEKFWIGIEAVYENIIFFHKYRKPDMPGHSGIYAVDVLSQNIIWQNEDLTFLFARNDTVFAYQTMFEGRNYFLLDSLTGKILQDLGSEYQDIKKMREELMQNDFANNFLFPEKLVESENNQDEISIFDHEIKKDIIAGDVYSVKFNNYLMFSFHQQNMDKTFDNFFEVYDILRSKSVIREKINSKLEKLVFDSFFMIGDLLFVLIEKSKLVVYKFLV